VLIEKEWVAFGHKFALRLGHAPVGRACQSPIFLQFLDAVWQILQSGKFSRSPDSDDIQCKSPRLKKGDLLDAVWQILQARRHAFEFKEELLLALADACLERRYGTFAFDSPVKEELLLALTDACLEHCFGSFAFDSPIWAPLYLRYADPPEAESCEAPLPHGSPVRPLNSSPARPLKDSPVSLSLTHMM
ncbi:hypothetical protein T484DRAFT_1764717, partial [Baffinella frigidus]